MIEAAEGIRWGIAGPGAIATQFADGMRSVSGGTVVAVGSRSAERADAFARRFDIPRHYGSYEELAADDAVDAVYVATPPSRHAADALLFLGAGKHVLCEKPFTLNATQTSVVVRAAREQDRFVMEAMWSRFLPAYVALRAILDEGRIGEPLLVEADFGWRSPVVPTDRHYDLEQGGGALLDLGVYTVQLCTLVLGAPDAVVAQGHVGTTGVDEVSAAVLHYPGGKLGVVKSAIRTPLTCTARIAGTEGTIELPAFMHCPDHLVVRDADGEHRIDGRWEGEGLRFQVDEVHGCLDAGLLESPRMPWHESIAIAEVLDAIRAQIGMHYPGEPRVTNASTGSRARPKAALAMIPGVDAQVLTPDARAELDTLVDLVAHTAVDLNALDADVLDEIEIVVGSWGCSVLDAALLERMPKLRQLAYAAGTVKMTVTPATWEHGVVVSSATAANVVPVAEFTFAAIVMIAKDVFRVRDAHRAAHGREPVVGHGPAGEVGTRGLRVGVIGASTIGRLVIERLSSLDVVVAVADPYLDDDDAAALGVERMQVDDLLGWADLVTVHAPELPSTRHLVNADRLARMHDGAWLVNTARGSIVDTDALTKECVAGRLCAFIDTPDPEPLPPDSPLYDLPNVVLTPHIAGSLGNEISRMGDLAVAEIRRFLAGEPLRHQVRPEDLERIA